MWIEGANRNITRFLIPAFASMVIGCNESRPEGQVIAVVDGVEVTVAELREEGRSRGISVDADLARRGVLVQELIERKLLAQEASRQKLDRTPEHLIAVQRLSEISLARQLVAAETARTGSPSRETIERYIAANPEVFDRRALLAVDVIRIPNKGDLRLKAALEAAGSFTEKEKILASIGFQGQSTREIWDSANLPTSLRTGAYAAGETFVATQDGNLLVGRVSEVMPQPMTGEQRLALARASIEQEQAEETLRRILLRLKPSSQITYQEGFAPH